MIGAGSQAENTRMGALPEGTLTLDLPTVAPPVSVPVIGLFLKA